MSTVKDILKEYFSPKGILLTTLAISTAFVGKDIIPKCINKSINVLDSINKTSTNIVKKTTTNDFITINFGPMKIFSEKVQFEDLIVKNRNCSEDNQIINIKYIDKQSKKEVEEHIDLSLLPKRKFISFHNESENMYYIFFKDNCGVIQLYKKPGESLEPAVV